MRKRYSLKLDNFPQIACIIVQVTVTFLRDGCKNEPVFRWLSPLVVICLVQEFLYFID